MTACLDSNCSGILISLSSVDKRICTDCKQHFDYKLKPGQESILIKGKKGEVSE